jgi:hypothetical protein
MLNLFSASVYSADAPLEYYNDSPGKQDIDIYNIEKKREIKSIGAISPDKTSMTYSIVDFYPNIRQFTSKVFLTNNISKITTSDKYASVIFETGLDSLEKQSFKTLTIVDWSFDSKKILIKEIQGEYLRGIWVTNIWLYNLETKKVQKLDDIRKAIVYYWTKNQDLALADLRWDIVPLGWDLSNNDMIIVNAYGYANSEKQFLGAWGIDIVTNCTMLLSLTKENLPVAKNGFKFVQKK